MNLKKMSKIRLLYRVMCRNIVIFFFFKQKTAYEMRISDWSSDVCSSDLPVERVLRPRRHRADRRARHHLDHDIGGHFDRLEAGEAEAFLGRRRRAGGQKQGGEAGGRARGASQGVGNAATLGLRGRRRQVRRSCRPRGPTPPCARRRRLEGKKG